MLKVLNLSYTKDYRDVNWTIGHKKMQRVVILEYADKESLDFDLYNSFRDIVYKKGEPLTPELLLKFSVTNIYRAEGDEEPLVSSATKAKQEEKQRLKQGGAPGLIKTPEEDLIPVYTNAIAEHLVGNTKQIIQKLEQGEMPDMSVCEATRDIVIDEITSKIDQVESISQLRIIDDYTFAHAVNVSSICSALALKLDFSENDIKDLTLGALLHDIGKTKVPEDILKKPTKLEPKEFEEMKRHTVHGYDIIKNQLKLSERIALVALEHQEKYNGSGYPKGLKGKEISLFAQVTAIADVYDSLISQRVYKKPMPSSDAIKIMIAEGSKAFNPFILYKFVYLANYKSTDEVVDDEEQQANIKDIIEGEEGEATNNSALDEEVLD